MNARLKFGCAKSNAPASGLACLSRSVIDGTPNVFSMNASTEENSYVVWSTEPPSGLLPCLVYGEMISAGVRGPSPMMSKCGGGTSSKNPPKSSHTTTIAVLFQYLLCMIALMCWTVQFSPAHTDTPEPGCSL